MWTCRRLLIQLGVGVGVRKYFLEEVVLNKKGVFTRRKWGGVF